MLFSVAATSAPGLFLLQLSRVCAGTPMLKHVALVADGVGEPPDPWIQTRVGEPPAAWIQMRAGGVGELPETWIQAWLRWPNRDSDFLLNYSQIRVTPNEVEAVSNGIESQLSVMTARANKARRCAKTMALSLKNGSVSEVAPIQADGFHAADNTEIATCAQAKLAFIHTYKSGGTTIASSLHRLCRESYGPPPLGESGFVCKNNPACAQSLSEAWSLMANYTWFTFVREPVSRFESSVFELARREKPCAIDAAKDGSVGDELALNILRQCLLETRQREKPDPHIKPQVSFFLEPDRTVTPLLAYVGHIEKVVDEWPTLVAAFFGAEQGAQVRASLLEDMLHARDSSGAEYAEDVPAKFRLQIAAASTRNSVRQAYRADDMCLDYAGNTSGDEAAPEPDGYTQTVRRS